MHIKIVNRENQPSRVMNFLQIRNTCDRLFDIIQYALVLQLQLNSLEQSSLNHNILDLQSQNFFMYQEKFKRSLDLKGINVITKSFLIFCNQKKDFHQRYNKMVRQQEIHGSIQNPVKHLRWSFLGKQLMAFSR